MDKSLLNGIVQGHLDTAKTKIRKDGDVYPTLYIGRADGEVREFKGGREAIAYMISSALTHGAAYVIFVSSAWVKMVKCANKEEYEAAKNQADIDYQYGDLEKDPNHTEAICVVAYLPDGTRKLVMEKIIRAEDGTIRFEPELIPDDGELKGYMVPGT
jgi:hypothetical protein